MTSPTPHYLLFCDGNIPAHGESAASQRGRWRFVLENLASGEKVEASDQEVGCAPDRAALTAVLRGLEALEQPSRVTLVTTSRYVTRGLQYGLTEWRDNDYTWEHFGAVQPIRNADIWKRIDRALAFHQVQCRWMAQETTADEHEEHYSDSSSSNASFDRPAKDANHNRELETASSSTAILAELAKPPSVLPSHKPSAHMPSARTVVSTSKYQRVYVDTPAVTEASNSLGAFASVKKAEEIARTASTQIHPAALASNEIKSQAGSNSEKVERNSNRAFQSITFPLMAILRCPLWLWRHFWAAILTLDEWLESFLRCLLLMEPSQKSTRH